jgi:hypothetical protein
MTAEKMEADNLYNELVKRYNMDAEGQKMLFDFSVKCALIGAKSASDAVITGVKDLATTGKYDYDDVKKKLLKE